MVLGKDYKAIFLLILIWSTVSLAKEKPKEKKHGKARHKKTGEHASKIQAIRTYGGNGQGQKCFLPFHYKRKIYNSCTMDGGKKPWCAITENFDQDKTWGYCQGAIRAYGGNSQAAFCIFPFKYQGKIHHTCTTSATSKIRWCSTTSNYDRDDKWAYCSATICPTATNLLWREVQKFVPAVGLREEIKGNSIAFCKQKCLDITDYKCYGLIHDSRTKRCVFVDETAKDKKAAKKKVPPNGFVYTYHTCDAGKVQTVGGNSKGATCAFPFKYQKNLYYSCITTTNKKKPWCSTSKDFDKHHRWGHCKGAEKTKGGNAKGKPCIFPFKYKDKYYYACIRAKEKSWCASTSNYDLDSEWGYCKNILQCPKGFSKVKGKCVPDQKKDNQVQSYAGNAEGASCNFPFWYNRKLYYSCIEENADKPWCATTKYYPLDKKWGFCKGSVKVHGGNSEGSSCIFPFKYRGKLYYHCTTFPTTVEWCSTTSDYDKDQKWGYCQAGVCPTGKNINWSSTTHYVLKNNKKNKVIPNTKSLARCRQKCLHEDTFTCKSMAYYVPSQLCVLSPVNKKDIGKKPLKSKPNWIYSEWVCEGDDIATYGGNAGGHACTFPFKYKSKVYYSCTVTDSKQPWCATTSNYDSEKSWGYCKSSVQTIGGTASGGYCAFPFMYKGRYYYSCTDKGKDNEWCSATSNFDLDQQWGYCRDDRCGINENIIWMTFNDMVIDGHNHKIVNDVSCVPDCEKLCQEEESFYCRSLEYFERGRACYLSKSTRKTAAKYFHHQPGHVYAEWKCQGGDVKTYDGTGKGQNCKFPFRYRNELYYSCIMKHSKKPWCGITTNYDTDKKWGYCKETTPAMRNNGKVGYCTFPFKYRGVYYYTCTKEDSHADWCSTTADYDEDRSWGYCGPVECDPGYNRMNGICVPKKPKKKPTTKSLPKKPQLEHLKVLKQHKKKKTLLHALKKNNKTPGKNFKKAPSATTKHKPTITKETKKTTQTTPAKLGKVTKATKAPKKKKKSTPPPPKEVGKGKLAALKKEKKMDKKHEKKALKNIVTKINDQLKKELNKYKTKKHSKTASNNGDKLSKAKKGKAKPVEKKMKSLQKEIEKADKKSVVEPKAETKAKKPPPSKKESAKKEPKNQSGSKTESAKKEKKNQPPSKKEGAKKEKKNQPPSKKEGAKKEKKNQPPPIKKEGAKKENKNQPQSKKESAKEEKKKQPLHREDKKKPPALDKKNEHTSHAKDKAGLNHGVKNMHSLISKINKAKHEVKKAKKEDKKKKDKKNVQDHYFKKHKQKKLKEHIKKHVNMETENAGKNKKVHKAPTNKSEKKPGKKEGSKEYKKENKKSKIKDHKKTDKSVSVSPGLMKDIEMYEHQKKEKAGVQQKNGKKQTLKNEDKTKQKEAKKKKGGVTKKGETKKASDVPVEGEIIIKNPRAGQIKLAKKVPGQVEKSAKPEAKSKGKTKNKPTASAKAVEEISAPFSKPPPALAKIGRLIVKTKTKSNPSKKGNENGCAKGYSKKHGICFRFSCPKGKTQKGLYRCEWIKCPKHFHRSKNGCQFVLDENKMDVLKHVKEKGCPPEFKKVGDLCFLDLKCPEPYLQRGLLCIPKCIKSKFSITTGGGCLYLMVPKKPTPKDEKQAQKALQKVGKAKSKSKDSKTSKKTEATQNETKTGNKNKVSQEKKTVSKKTKNKKVSAAHQPLHGNGKIKRILAVSSPILP